MKLANVTNLLRGYVSQGGQGGLLWGGGTGLRPAGVSHVLMEVREEGGWKGWYRIIRNTPGTHLKYARTTQKSEETKLSVTSGYITNHPKVKGFKSSHFSEHQVEPSTGGTCVFLQSVNCLGSPTTYLALVSRPSTSAPQAWEATSRLRFLPHFGKNKRSENSLIVLKGTSLYIAFDEIVAIRAEHCLKYCLLLYMF